MDTIYVAINRITRGNAGVTIPECLGIVLAKIEIMYVFGYTCQSACKINNQDHPF